jgi:phosphate-selective porin OprO/OprP
MQDDDAGIEKRFADIEEEISGLSDAIGDKSIARSGTSRNTMIVNGRIHADVWSIADTDGAVRAFEGVDGDGNPAGLLDPQNRIGFRRVRFGVKGDIDTNMEYKIEMEFAGGNDVEFRDVYIGWNDLPILRTLLLGNQKRPYGLDHLNSSRYNVFLERPFIIESFNQDARRFGLCSYGVSEDQRYNWRYGVYNQRLIQDEGNYIWDHAQLEFAGRFANTIWYDECSGGRGYAHWAISGTVADPDGTAVPQSINEARFRQRPEARTRRRWIDTGHILGADVYYLLGLEKVVNFGPLQVVTEYQKVWLEREAGFGRQLDFDGWYVYASYFLTGEHMPWKRSSGTLDRIKPFQDFWLVHTCNGSTEAGWGAWQVAARYSYADLTDDNIFGGVGNSFTFGLNWYWNPNSRMQFNYIYGDIDERFATLDQGNYSIFGARFMVDF